MVAVEKCEQFYSASYEVLNAYFEVHDSGWRDRGFCDGLAMNENGQSRARDYTAATMLPELMDSN